MTKFRFPLYDRRQDRSIPKRQKAHSLSWGPSLSVRMGRALTIIIR